MDLRKVRVCGRPMNISVYDETEKPSRSSLGKKGFGKKVFGNKTSGKKVPGKKVPGKRTMGKLSLGSKASMKAKHRKGKD